MVVYQLTAHGLDGFAGLFQRSIQSTVLFATYEAAESRIDSMRAKILDNRQLEIPIEFRITPFEVIE